MGDEHLAYAPGGVWHLYLYTAQGSRTTAPKVGKVQLQALQQLQPVNGKG